MLCQFSFQNFKSYKAETTFDFQATINLFHKPFKILSLIKQKQHLIFKRLRYQSFFRHYWGMRKVEKYFLLV